MKFDLENAVPVLSRTPRVLDALLRGLPAEWHSGTEGPETWSPYDVVGHLINADRTNWMPRAEHLLAHGEAAPFPAFDRLAQFEISKGKSLPELLETFGEVRAESLRRLADLRLTSADLRRTGLHPEFGTVALVAASPDGYKQFGHFSQPDRSTQNTWPHPVIAGGKLYLRDQDTLLCYDIKAK